MSWAWIRPADASVLDGRPLLDLGCGDGQTARALAPEGYVLCLDRSIVNLGAARRTGCGRLVCADAGAIPARAAFRTVLAADLFHHLDDGPLVEVLREVRRVLVDGGRLVAWWYGRPPAPTRRTPDAPRFARTYEEVAAYAQRAGLGPRPLDIEVGLDPAPPTAALVARPSGSPGAPGGPGSSGSTS